MPLALLSDFLGHASLETTRIYAYADTEMKRNAIEKSVASISDDVDTPIWDTSDEETLRRLAGLKQNIVIPNLQNTCSTKSNE